MLWRDCKDSARSTLRDLLFFLEAWWFLKWRTRWFYSCSSSSFLKILPWFKTVRTHKAQPCTISKTVSLHFRPVSEKKVIPLDWLNDAIWGFIGKLSWSFCGLSFSAVVQIPENNKMKKKSVFNFSKSSSTFFYFLVLFFCSFLFDFRHCRGTVCCSIMWIW